MAVIVKCPKCGELHPVDPTGTNRIAPVPEGIAPLDPSTAVKCTVCWDRGIIEIQGSQLNCPLGCAERLALIHDESNSDASSGDSYGDSPRNTCMACAGTGRVARDQCHYCDGKGEL